MEWLKRGYNEHMGTNKSYSMKARPIGRYASALEASWALHLRSMCESVQYSGAIRQSFDFLVESGGRKLAVEIKPQFKNDHSAESDSAGIPDIVYEAAARSYRKQVEHVCHHGLTATLIACGFPESARWYLVLCESDDRRYRHRHMRRSKLWSDDIHSRSGSDYTIYVLDTVPPFGGHLLEWLQHAVDLECMHYVNVVDPRPLVRTAMRSISDKQKKKLQNRARQAIRNKD
ncbi:MAG: hypothetical protein AAF404_04130 [Pseudomonadota bacterium]